MRDQKRLLNRGRGWRRGLPLTMLGLSLLGACGVGDARTGQTGGLIEPTQTAIVASSATLIATSPTPIEVAASTPTLEGVPPAPLTPTVLPAPTEPPAQVVPELAHPLLPLEQPWLALGREGRDICAWTLAAVAPSGSLTRLDGPIIPFQGGRPGVPPPVLQCEPDGSFSFRREGRQPLRLKLTPGWIVNGLPVLSPGADQAALLVGDPSTGEWHITAVDLTTAIPRSLASHDTPAFHDYGFGEVSPRVWLQDGLYLHSAASATETLWRVDTRASEPVPEVVVFGNEQSYSLIEPGLLVYAGQANADEYHDMIYNGQSWTPRLRLRDMLTGEEELIAEGHFWLPQLSADGRQLAYLRPIVGEDSAHRADLLLYDRASKTSRTLVSGLSLGELGGQLRWLEGSNALAAILDGRLLLFSSSGEPLGERTLSDPHNALFSLNGSTLALLSGTDPPGAGGTIEGLHELSEIGAQLSPMLVYAPR